MGALTAEIMRDRFGFHPGEVSHDMFARGMVWYDQFGSYLMDRDLGLEDLVSLRVRLEDDEFVILVGQDWVIERQVEEGSIQSVITRALYMVTKNNHFRIEKTSVGVPYVYQGTVFPILSREEALTMVLAMRAKS